MDRWCATRCVEQEEALVAEGRGEVGDEPTIVETRQEAHRSKGA